jgi:Porin subfamily
MKMVKSLLLASAAGLVATAGAQAADLPVKAKAVEYVKICSLYGIGFYYIPGTDTCIRIGGHLRSEYGFGNNVGVQNWGANQVFQDRASDYIYSRQRVFMHTDVRTQTEYGTLRAYSVIRWEYATPIGNVPATQTLGIDIGFIQWGGFLIGRAPDSAYTMPWNYGTTYNASATLGNADWAGARMVTQYTYQFGNGVSATLSIEEAKQASQRATFNGGAIVGTVNPLTGAVVTNANVGAQNTAIGLAATQLSLPGAALPNSYGGTRMPDIVGQLRVDQAWGTFQVAGALHENHALYYGGTEPTGHPNDVWGGAVTAGIKLNVPTGTGDYVAFDGSWALGATAYVLSFNGGLTGNPALFAYNTPAGAYQSLNFGYIADNVYAAGTALQLPTTWGARIAFNHNWNANWASSLYAGYAKQHYNATANAILCNSSMGGAGATAANTTLVSRLSGGVCNNDYAATIVGSRTVWTPVKDFTLGAEVLASFHHSWNNGQFYTGTTGDPFKPNANYWLKDVAIVSGLFTVRRYF